MLRSLNSLYGSPLGATDGECGNVHDFLFEDDSWEIKYLVVDTGNWLPGRKVLVPPSVIGRSGLSDRALPVRLTRRQIRESPDIDTDKPVSRQQLTILHNYYGWPGFMAGAGFIGPPAIPPPLPSEEQNELLRLEESSDPHLRSVLQVRGYHLSAIDGEIGHITDFLFDDARWVIPFVIASTYSFGALRAILIPSCSVTAISWKEHTVHLDRARKALIGSTDDGSAAAAHERSGQGGRRSDG